MNFSMKLTPNIESPLWGAVDAAAVCALVGFMFGGWVRGHLTQLRSSAFMITTTAKNLREIKAESIVRRRYRTAGAVRGRVSPRPSANVGANQQ